MSTQLTIRDRLQSDAFREQIAMVLPNHIKPERMVRVACTAMLRTPKLAECDQTSFFNAMLQLSQWGLEPDGRRAHLIPFRNNKENRTECQLILDYKGLVELILRAGNVASIHADKVCDADEFVYDCGQIVSHRIDFRKPRGEVYAYYCIITRKDGTKKCEVMSMEEVNAIRDRSQGYKSAIQYKKTHPWITDPDEMGKKTVFKRASKWCELSSEIRDAIEHDDRDTVDGRVTRSAVTADDIGRLLAPTPAPVDYAVEIEAAATLPELLAIESDLLATDPDSPLLARITDRLAGMAAESSA
jgi:recombination protein RecT